MISVAVVEDNGRVGAVGDAVSHFGFSIPLPAVGRSCPLRRRLVDDAATAELSVR